MTELENEKYREIFELIRRHKVTVREFCKDNHISNKTLKKKFIIAGCDTNLIPKGRRHSTIDEMSMDEIIQYRCQYRCGYKRTQKAINILRMEQDVYDRLTQNKVHEFFKQRDMFVVIKLTKKEKHKKRFVARFVNQIWHIDLHYFQKISYNNEIIQKYLLAVIDDRSRYIIYWKVIEDKSALTVSSNLLFLLSHHEAPSRMVCDNGKEFTASVVKNILDHFNVKQYRIKAYTPEENGKIERWWQTLESSLYKKEDISKVIEQYNKYWPHSSLRALYGRDTTPFESYSHDTFWNPSLPDELIY